jgi:hypothetical protein
MECIDNIERIAEICTELLKIIDDSRANCESDECELIHCVVHDSVQNMRRVIGQWNPESPVHLDSEIVQIVTDGGPPVN